MALNIYNWSKIYNPPFTYVDDSFVIDTSSNLFEQGMLPTRATIFEQLNGQTINSYNSFYLSTGRKLSDGVTFTQIPNNLNSITTYLKFRVGATYKYLKFAPNGYQLVDGEDEVAGLTRFQVVFHTNRTAYIRHIRNNTEYRLCCENNGTIYFATTATSQANSLGYLIDSGGYLALYNTSQQPHKIISCNGSSLMQLPLSAGEITKGSSVLINIDYNFTLLDYDIDSSWVGYDKLNLNFASVDDTRSAYKLDNQYLFTTTYNNAQKDININFINLKTNISESNVVKRGSTLNTGPEDVPSVDFRFYSSINTGNTQEKGNENIVLTYVFYDKDIKIPPGTDTYFTTPSSIFPYDRLNINDTKFVVNGAYGSISPTISDRVKKLQTSSSCYNNGRYLCTWLSGNGLGNDYKWVDRYYYPDIVSKEEAYAADLFNPSFDAPIDNIVYSQLYKQEINRSPIFDKTSDLFIEPNTQYIYQRIDSSDFVNYFANLSSNLVYSNKNQLRLIDGISTSIDVKDINNTKTFTLVFDAYLKKNTNIGYSILGNLTNFGVSILSDTFITPVIATISEKTIHLYNTDFKLLAKQRFERNIKDVIRFDGIDNYIVVCDDGYVYNLTYNNVITRLNIIDTLSSYVSYTSYNDTVAFLLDSSGSCIAVNNNTLEHYTLSATNTSTRDISSIFYYISGLKGVPGVNCKLYDKANVCYIDSNTIYKQNIVTDVRVPVIQSASTMHDYAIDKYGNYLSLHDTDKLSLHNKNRGLIFSHSLSTIPLSGNKCDFIRQYVGNSEDSHIVVCGLNSAQKTQLLSLDYNGNLSTSEVVMGNLSATGTSLTNYNYFINVTHTNSLRFKIRLPNYKNNLDIYTNTITYDYSRIADGFVNFGYIFDSVRGIVKLLVNGIPVSHINFDPAKYSLNNLFEDNIILGSVGFYNSTKLSDYLKQPTNYNTANTILKNVNLFNIPLREREVSSLSLIDTTIDNIHLSIPCGQRNNIEEIDRVFKFGVPESYSNHIKIEVKNSGITNTDLQDTLKAKINNSLNKIIKSDVVVDGISFVDYTAPV